MDTKHLENVLEIVDLEEVDTRAAYDELKRIKQALEEAETIFKINNDEWSKLWLKKWGAQ